MKFIIWSNEHHAYWAANSKGYTTSLDTAGRYTLAEATVICQGKFPKPDPEKLPDEVMLLAPEYHDEK